MEKPIVQAILLCDQVITDEQSKKKSVIGILSSIKTRSLPVSIQRCALFASLSNGNGPSTVELRCVRVDTDEVIFAMKGPIIFPNPNAVVDLVVAINGVTFKEAGTYSFMLFWEDELLSERRFGVFLKPPGTTSAST